MRRVVGRGLTIAFGTSYGAGSSGGVWGAGWKMLPFAVRFVANRLFACIDGAYMLSSASSSAYGKFGLMLRWLIVFFLVLDRYGTGGAYTDWEFCCGCIPY